MKIQHTTKLGVAACMLLMATPSIHAAPVESKNIDATSKWLIHIDFDALLKTEIAQHALADNPKLSDQKLEALKNIIGIDLKTGLHGATIYGNGAPDNGVIIVHADAKPDNLINFAKLNDEYKEDSYQDHTIHNLPDKKNPGKRNHICFYSSDKIIVSQSPALVRQSIHLLDGKRESKQVNEEMKELADYQDNPVLLAHGDFSALRKGKRGKHAASFDQAKRVGISLGETEGQIRAMIGIIAQDSEVAVQLETFLRGMIAIGQLSADKNPALGTLANSVQIRRNNNDMISMELDIETIKLIEAGEAVKQHKRARKAKTEEAASE